MSDTVQEVIRTKRQPVCVFCGSAGKVLHQGMVDPFFDSSGVWTMKQCLEVTCGLLWLDPAPIAEDLHLAYRQYFTHGAIDGRPNLATRLRARLFPMYLALASVPALLAGLRRSKHQILRMFLDDLEPGKLLDVGCGKGVFLNRMRKMGWAVDGIDFDPKAIETAKVEFDLELRCGDLASARLAPASFDVVTLSPVIEQVDDPVALLKEVRRILTPGGRWVITTPNSASLGHREFGPYWFGLDPPRHVKVYSPNSLARLGRAAGFIECTTFSTAANADTFAGGSLSIRESPHHRTSHHPPVSLGRTIKAVRFQYREHFLTKRDPELGEEAVLITQNPTA